jgi:hypothetical protein
MKMIGSQMTAQSWTCWKVTASTTPLNRPRPGRA